MIRFFKWIASLFRRKPELTEEEKRTLIEEHIKQHRLAVTEDTTKKAHSEGVSIAKIDKPEELEIEEGNVFALMDTYDDNIIKDELTQKKTLEKYVYSFKDSSGKQVTGLSKAGVDVTCQVIARKGIVIRDIESSHTENETSYMFKAKAGRFAVDGAGKEVLLDTAEGFKKQDKQMKCYVWENGKKTNKTYMKDNQFAFEQGGIKASRNAKLRLIPADLVAMMIEDKINKGSVKQHNVKGVIDDHGDIKKRTTTKVDDTAKEKAKLFKQIIEQGKVPLMNKVLNGRTKDQLNIEELRKIVATSIDAPATTKGKPKEFNNLQEAYGYIWETLKKGKDWTFAVFYQESKAMFPEINLTSADRKEINVIVEAFVGKEKI